MTIDLKTEDFTFDLPSDRIAQVAAEPRDHARLLHVAMDSLTDRHIHDLPDLLRRDDLLVINNTKVIPARLFGQREAVTVETLLHRKQPDGTWTAFARPGKRLKPGDRIEFAADFSAEVIEKFPSGEISLRFAVSDEALGQLLARYGAPPLPPYIKRDKASAQAEQARYQTIYAKHEGAIAAPTAGLHFTPELMARLAAKGIEIVPVTLHVGAGTFFPVKVDLIKDHVMHSEWGEISAEAAAAINRAKAAGRRIVAIGTTSLRLLESAAQANGDIMAYSGDTDIFISPGYRFRIVDALLTNFHLPRSTLFMLVCAFAGMERMKQAYHYAIAQNYRFYSYGDASLLERAAS